MKRLEAVSRSPVLTSLSEAISGSATIRAYGCGPRLVQRHEQLVNISLSNIHTGNCLVRWLGVRLETLGALATLMSAVVAVEQRGGASNAGLVLSYAMQLTILMSLTLRQSSVLENNVRRVLPLSGVEFLLSLSFKLNITKLSSPSLCCGYLLPIPLL